MRLARRAFLKETGILTLAALSSSLHFAKPVFATPHEGLHSKFLQADDDDEDYWHYISSQFTVSPHLHNLNNGGVSPQPVVVQNAFQYYNRLANEAPAYHLFRDFEAKRQEVVNQLAQFAGCKSTELALCRNTTEALETIIFGIPINKGEEILTTDQDYPHMLMALEQRAQRDGITVKKISLPAPVEDDDAIVRLFENAITSRTRYILCCHMLYTTGQILPVRKIADMAHRHGIEIIIDAAHSFGHIQFRIDELDCDYLGTSLHKWLCAPFGCGMMFIKEEKIHKVWPLFGAPMKEKSSIKKFSHLGTRSYPAELAISDALNFHESIGSERKENRLRYLKDYWVNAIKDLPGIRMHTSFLENYACGIAAFSIEGMESQQIHQILHKEYNLYTTVTYFNETSAVRVSPHIYTTTDTLNRLIDAIHTLTG